MKKIYLTALASLAALSLSACQSLDPGALGLSPGTGEKDVSAMDCTQLAKYSADLGANQRRMEAVARLAGTDLSSITSQFAEIRQKLYEAQSLAGCS